MPLGVLSYEGYVQKGQAALASASQEDWALAHRKAGAEQGGLVAPRWWRFLLLSGVSRGGWGACLQLEDLYGMITNIKDSCAHAYVHVCTHVHKEAHRHMHACTHAHTHARAHTLARTHTRTHAHTHVHTHARTHTRTHISRYFKTHARTP